MSFVVWEVPLLVSTGRGYDVLFIGVDDTKLEMGGAQSWKEAITYVFWHLSVFLGAGVAPLDASSS
jgi:hypothetical protein